VIGCPHGEPARIKFVEAGVSRCDLACIHHNAAAATDERLPFGVARCFSPRWDYRKVLERGLKLRATGKIVANVDDLDRLQHTPEV